METGRVHGSVTIAVGAPPALSSQVRVRRVRKVLPEDLGEGGLQSKRGRLREPKQVLHNSGLDSTLGFQPVLSAPPAAGGSA